MEEARQKYLAQMQESTLGDDREDVTETSSLRVPKGLSFGAKSSNSIMSRESPKHGGLQE